MFVYTLTYLFICLLSKSGRSLKHFLNTRTMIVHFTYWSFSALHSTFKITKATTHRQVKSSKMIFLREKWVRCWFWPSVWCTLNNILQYLNVHFAAIFLSTARGNKLGPWKVFYGVSTKHSWQFLNWSNRKEHSKPDACFRLTVLTTANHSVSLRIGSESCATEMRKLYWKSS